jgi:hypothetical protein
MVSKPKSEFVSGTAISFEIVKKIADKVWALGGNDVAIRRIITDAALQEAIAKLIVGNQTKCTDFTFPVVVDYGRSLDAMITEGRYAFVSGDVNGVNFPFTGSGKVEVSVTLVHLNRMICSDVALSDIASRGFRPATILELLALGATYPELQQQYPIVALGSVCNRPYGHRFVASLELSSKIRTVSYQRHNRDWEDIYRFACVRTFRKQKVTEPIG